MIIFNFSNNTYIDPSGETIYGSGLIVKTQLLTDMDKITAVAFLTRIVFEDYKKAKFIYFPSYTPRIETKLIQWDGKDEFEIQWVVRIPNDKIFTGFRTLN